MKAIIFNLLAWVMLPIMDGFAKYLSADLPVLQITWARYFFTVAFTLPVMFFFYNKQLVWSDKPKLQILRGLILLSANVCFFYSISVMISPLATVPLSLALIFRITPSLCALTATCIFIDSKVQITSPFFTESPCSTEIETTLPGI